MKIKSNKLSREDYLRNYYQENKERILEQQKIYKEANKDKRFKRELRRYGITVEDYDEMLRGQGGVCAICLLPPGARRLGVDHDHDTGEVRGLLCTTCNYGLGMFGEDPEMLYRAAGYLDGG